MLFTRSTDEGATFDNEIMTLGANMGTEFFGFRPAISANGNNIFVAWADGSLGNAEIFYRRDGSGFDPFTHKTFFYSRNYLTSI